MDWFVTFESAAEVDVNRDEHAGLLGGSVFSAQFTERPEGGQWARVTIQVTAADHAEAARKATRAYNAAVARMRAGALGHVFRVVVEDVDAPTGSALLSTAAVAARLGVSDARVRQLAQRDDFPRPLDIPGLAGAVYRAAAVDAWAKTWDRDAKGGRPRKAD